MSDHIVETSEMVASTAAPPKGCGWRGIETIPFDGRQVLLWHRGQVRACVVHRGDAASYRRWGVSHWQPVPMPPPVAVAADKQAAYAAARREWWAMIERVLDARLRELQEGKRDG